MVKLHHKNKKDRNLLFLGVLKLKSKLREN